MRTIPQNANEIRPPERDDLSNALAQVAEVCPPLAVLIKNCAERVKGAEDRYLEMVEGATLVSRTSAAKMLDMSLDSFDRQVSAGRIQAKYADARPRFQLSEIRRFINSLPTKYSKVSANNRKK